jgi:hypothetical protein
VEVLLQTYIRVLQLKNNEEKELGEEKNQYFEHVKIVRPQNALGAKEDQKLRG